MQLTKSQNGYMILLTLIFIFVMTLITISQINRVALVVKSVAALKTHELLYHYAEIGVMEVEQKMVGEYTVLPQSNIDVNMLVLNQMYDACGNKIVTIKSIVNGYHQKLILQVRDIFARVPIAKGCKQLPRIQRVWWREGEA